MDDASDTGHERPSASGCGAVRRWRLSATIASVASALLAFMVVIALVVLQPPREEPQTASGSPAAPAEGNEAGCDPATINRDDPAAGGIGPDCKYYPPIVRPPRRVPDELFRAAHDRYVGRYTDLDPAAGGEELKLVVLRLSPAEMEANRRYAVEHRWHRRFLADLEEAIIWGERLRNGDPREVYDLAKGFRAAGQRGNAPDFAFWLQQLAIDKGLSEAIFDQALRLIDGQDPDKWWLGRDYLREAAFANYMPALKEITARLQSGRGYPADNLELYYWLLRARDAGLAVNDELRQAEATIERAQIELIERLHHDHKTRWPYEFSR